MGKSHLLGIVLVAGLIPSNAAADPQVHSGPVTTVYFGGRRPVRSAPACPEAVTVVRRMGDGHEEVFAPLLDCDRRVRADALRDLSLLARPRGLQRPSDEELSAFDSGARPGFLTEEVRELHPGLLERLQTLSEAVQGHPIEILSGFRPDAAITSRHHHGRALDLRVQGVERETVRDVLVAIDGSGVGWYPNSIFVHLDVRDQSTYWVDESGPGEAPRYVRGARPPDRGSAPTPQSAPEAPEAPPVEASESDLSAIQRETDLALSGIRIEL